MKVTIKGFINTPHKYSYEYEFSPLDMKDYQYAEGRVTVVPYSFEVEIPDDFDPRPQQIAALQAERTKVEAEFSARVTAIERQISELTSLEMS